MVQPGGGGGGGEQREGLPECAKVIRGGVRGGQECEVELGCGGEGQQARVRGRRGAREDVDGAELGLLSMGFCGGWGVGRGYAEGGVGGVQVAERGWEGDGGGDGRAEGGAGEVDVQGERRGERQGQESEG